MRMRLTLRGAFHLTSATLACIISSSL